MTASKPRILLVCKQPLVDRLGTSVLDRLMHSKVLEPERIASARNNHEKAAQCARAALHGCDVIEAPIDKLHAQSANGCDLIITIGGDGTVLAASAIGETVPLLTVNSDPDGSIGIFTRTLISGLPALLDSWRHGTAIIEEIPRLAVRIDGGPAIRFLNDCLVASNNPAAMTRYVLEVGGHREHQRSSGMWISTAAGSTAGIHSAGMASVSPHLPALLYKVREPFQGYSKTVLCEGVQTPPVGLRLIPAMPDITLYIDGPHQRWLLQPGSQVDILPWKEPLRLISGVKK